MQTTPAVLRAPTRRVSPRARLLWFAGAVVRVAILVAILLIVTGPWHWFPMASWAWTALGVIAAVYAVTMPLLRYRTHRWEHTDGAVYTQTGWISRYRRIAPLSRVQTVDVAQGAVSRILKLATVTVTTASAKGPLRIAGLPRTIADEVVADLTARTEHLTDDAT